VLTTLRGKKPPPLIGLFILSKRINFRLHRRRRLVLTGLVSLAQFAADQHVDRSTVYYWIATQRIVAYKAGGRWFIDPDSVGRAPLYWGAAPLVGIKTKNGN